MVVNCYYYSYCLVFGDFFAKCAIDIKHNNRAFKQLYADSIG